MRVGRAEKRWCGDQGKENRSLIPSMFGGMWGFVALFQNRVSSLQLLQDTHSGFRELSLI